MRHKSINAKLVWNVALSCAVCAIWLEAACSGQQQNAVSTNQETKIIDDDEYDFLPTEEPSPTATPTFDSSLTPTTSTQEPGDDDTEGLPPGDDDTFSGDDDMSGDDDSLPPIEGCRLEGVIEVADPVPSTDAQTRLALYLEEELNASQLPADPSHPHQFTMLQQDVIYPYSFTEPVPEQDRILVEAWLDINEDGSQNTEDMLGYSQILDTHNCPVTTTITMTRVSGE